MAPSDVTLTHGQVKVEAWDLCVDSKDRRKLSTPHRRALVHDFQDGLTINWGNDYPNGVTLKGVRTVEGHHLGGTTKTEFKDVVAFRGAVECFSSMRLIANSATWTQITHDNRQRLVIESKVPGKPKDIVFRSPILVDEINLMGRAYVLLYMKAGGGFTKPPMAVTDQLFEATSGTSLKQAMGYAGQIEADSLIKVDVVDALATLVDAVGKLRSQLSAAESKIDQLGQEVANLKAQVG